LMDRVYQALSSPW